MTDEQKDNCTKWDGAAVGKFLDGEGRFLSMGELATRYLRQKARADEAKARVAELEREFEVACKQRSGALLDAVSRQEKAHLWREEKVKTQDQAIRFRHERDEARAEADALRGKLEAVRAIVQDDFNEGPPGGYHEACEGMLAELARLDADPPEVVRTKIVFDCDSNVLVVDKLPGKADDEVLIVKLAKE